MSLTGEARTQPPTSIPGLIPTRAGPVSRVSCGWRSTGQDTLPGIITRPGGTAEHRFSNWIDLMSATDALRAGADEDAGPCDQEPNST
jgi:hypothetical protein